MQPAELLIGADELMPGAPERGLPLALVDLDRAAATARTVALPPVPVIGVGNAQHPLAATLDAVIEPPVSVASVIAGVARQPHAAAVIVQLLRATAGLAPRQALLMESISYGLLQGSAGFSAWLAARAPGAPRAAPGRVRIERSGDELRLTLDRPEARNAIDVAMRDALHEALTVAALDPALRAIALRGNGTCFCVGGDLDEFGSARDPAAAHLVRCLRLPATLLVECGARLHVRAHGASIGAGVEMAAFAAQVSATPDAWFQLPELSMGLLPGAGGTVSVPRRIGRQRAVLLMLSGRRINAQTALRWGLIDAIEP